MFGGMVSKLSTLARKIDLIPNILNASYSADTDPAFSTSNNAYFQITGISQPINLKLSWPDVNVEIYYAVTNLIGIYPTEYAQNLTPIFTGDTISVSNGQFVFIGGWSADNPITTSVSVLNNSYSDTLLTTVTVDII